ncbi:N-acetyltransferase [Flavobacterium sp. PL002]|uniref:GNAT family N-acetyltransferase n=1 Tax=Flavobacterium sp. PL002 TaxID=1897058 RepID=UPI001787B760|nr:GNAT family N-acetyltransferase [Flavobacterium sp. PL002]MBE0391148.1 hypothetical protein [Flavobacterium sp. PL002]
MKEQIIELFKNLNTEFIMNFSDIGLENYVEKIIKKASIISIIKNDILIGFIAYYDNEPNKEMAFLTMIIVKEEFENLGYGKSLLEFSLKEIIGKGFKKYGLKVHVENKYAIRLYEKYGFVKIERELNFFYMEKKISQ